MKKAYYYLFYKLYKFWDYISIPKFWTDFKAGVSIIVLQIWLIVSILIYYKLYINLNLDIAGTKMQWVMGVLILVVIDYFIFYYKDQWKEIILDFDKLPKKKNIIGGWIVFSIIILIIANLIFSFYCLALNAKKNKIGRYSPEFIVRKKLEDSINNAKYKEEMQNRIK